MNRSADCIRKTERFGSKCAQNVAVLVLFRKSPVKKNESRDHFFFSSSAYGLRLVFNSTRNGVPAKLNASRKTPSK